MKTSILAYFGACLLILTLGSYLWGIGPAMAGFGVICGTCSFVAMWLLCNDGPIEEPKDELGGM